MVNLLITGFTGCDSVGDVFHPTNSGDCRPCGDLGPIEVANDGRASFRREDHVLKLTDIIGRSLVVNAEGKRVVCGVIARSAGLFQNPKTICACDGVTIWDEKVPPKAVL